MMTVSYDAVDAMRYNTIMRVMNGVTFSARMSWKIVGGRTRLMQLIEQGHIRADKGNVNAQNGKWLCNASDVLKYAKIKHSKKIQS